MNSFSKLTLSADEQQLVNNTEWILTKHKIMDTVNRMLVNISEQQKQVIANEKYWLPDAVVRSTPKIAKGENYLQLPYMLLDYPRCFDANNIFAVRTMFWWGNFFSITLHVSGIYKENFQKKIIANMNVLRQDLFICINENQWQHNFNADNYMDVKEMSVESLLDMIEQKPFIKLAIKFPLQLWNDIPQLLDDAFTKIITMLKN